jgi:hypothetical protein
METNYSSFLIRCWSSPDGAARLVVEHVQSGERVAVPDFTAAARWLATWAVLPLGGRDPPGAGRGSPGQVARGDGRDGR